jgi:lipoprotein-anchoring transpeptidase ErfK/SrfK
MSRILKTIAAACLCTLTAVTALAPAQALAGSELVGFDKGYPLGSIIVVNHERRLYYVIGNGRAMRYPVAVGSAGNQWTGQSFVSSRAVNPSWTPPWSPGHTVPGGAGNPLGVRALYLGWTNYRIHGTNQPGSIGSPASHGCVRMFNADIVDLYDRIHIGAPVYVVNALPPDIKFATPHAQSQASAAL